MKNSSTTPMMSQYIKIKAQYSDALLFYRMGDFYELFFEDAEVASATLNITLTKRGKHNGLDIPMCGVPYHSSETYLLNLIRSGFKVAICEQLETPEEAKKRGYKAVVNRNVVRLITPGTITEDGLLNQSQNNFLLSWKEENGFCGVAWADISTGELFCSKLTKLELPSLINRVLPSEILCKVEAESDSQSFSLNKKVMISTLPDQNFDPTISKKRLAKYFDIISTAIFGDISLVEECAIGALISYLEITQFNEAPILTLPKREKSDLFMKIDIASRKNLEITESLHGNLEGSLLGAVDQTLTSGGSRVLQNRLKCPEKNVIEITNRQDTIAFFASHRALLREIRQTIVKSPDMQRSLSRLNLKRGSPRDLIVIKNCLRIMLSCVSLLDNYSHPILLKNIFMALKGFDDLSLLLSSALVESPPPTLKEGHFIRDKDILILYSPVKLKYSDKFNDINKVLQNMSLSLEEIIFNNVSISFLWKETSGTEELKLILNDFDELNNF